MKLKMILFFCLGLLLVGCQSHRAERFPWFVAQPKSTGTQTQQSVRAAVLLPLSGKSASLGEAFRNSGMMALQEQKNSPLELMFFDTKGTADGTTEAWYNARAQYPDIIIGPVFAAELQALKSESPHIPVLSFTTDHSLMNRDVYSMGILIPNQVERLVQHMCEAGQNRVAVIGPEDKTGELTMNVLSDTVTRCPGMTVDKVSLYAPDTTNFNQAVLKIVPKPVDTRKKELTEEEQKILKTPIEERLEFDALFIFEDGIKLQQITSLLAYYDVTPKVVPFYGLANWQTAKDRGLIGGYFSATNPEKANRFNARYQSIFGSKPPRIASLGYDAVSLVATLARHKALTRDNLIQDQGFNGVNGRFRLTDDGMNERLLTIYQIGPGLRMIPISPEPEHFTDFYSSFQPPVQPDTTTFGIETPKPL